MSAIRVGGRYYSAASTTEVIIVRAADVALECAGQPMAEQPTGASGDATAQLVLGKRYEDADSGLLVMCTKSGAGPLTADGRELTLVAAKPLPSSD